MIRSALRTQTLCQGGRVRSLLSNVTPRWASTLVIAESGEAPGSVSPSTLSTITCATKIGNPVEVLVTGHGANVDGVAKAASSIDGVSKVLVVQSESLKNSVAEDLAKTVVAVVKKGGYSHVLAPSSNNGKNFLPRAAALMDSSPLTDVTGVVDASTFQKPMYAGNAIATVQMSDAVKFLLVRPTAFGKADAGAAACPIDTSLNLSKEDTTASLTTFLSQNVSKSERPVLTSSRVVVSGGRGMKNGENFKMLETLADKLGGAVGASRAAVDAGFVPNEYQIGQTGKVVAPDLYIAVGISGAIQHLSGMKDSKTIVAINKDKEAPIFQVADYGLVDDLFKVVPEMNSKV